jgi:hypothetical protein
MVARWSTGVIFRRSDFSVDGGAAALAEASPIKALRKTAAAR